MTRLSITIATGIYLLFSGVATGQDINIVRPTFIESAVFLLTGREPPEAIVLSGTAIRLRDEPIDFQQVKDDPCLVYEKQTAPPYGIRSWNFAYFPGPRSASTGAAPRLSLGHSDYSVGSDGRPKRSEVGPTTSAVCWSKRRFTEGSGKMEIVPGSTICGEEVYLTLGATVYGGGKSYVRFEGSTAAYRQLAALRYIRDNFCAGLPEPPLTIKPY